MHGWRSTAPLSEGRLLAILTLVLTLASDHPTAQAATVNAATCAPTDVQNAVNAAVIGDTVRLPSCTYLSWNTTVTITKAIILEGTGTTLTVLNRTAAGALAMFRASAVTGFEMRNLTVDGTYDTNPDAFVDTGVELINNCVNFRIHHIAFRNLAQGVYVEGNPTIQTGVIDHNTFTDIYYTGSWGYGVVVYGNATYPALSLGTATNIFIEDNTFTRNRHTVASNNGSRYVYRSNSVFDNRENAAAIDAHGKSSSPRGSRQYEIYNNTVSNAVARYGGVDIRGGDGVVFNNQFSSNITEEIQLDVETGCTGTYPIQDQIRELYIWNNTLISGGAAPIFLHCPTYTQLNRDYFTVPRPGYTSYTYPHPLTQIVTTPPLSPPQNVRVTSP